MSDNIENKARKLWDVWNLRCAVLTSLAFQVVLTVFANSRKTRRSRVGLTGIIWLAYLLADWTAAFAVGLISSGQTNDCPEKNVVNNQLAAFWAPFLLLHLGGPDAITAFSLEDNELWIRHFFGLAIQLVAVVYVFVQSLPNEYWIPTVLMFFAGACKYAERTISLYRACLVNFKRSLDLPVDPGPNYAQLMEEYDVIKASHVPVRIIIEKASAAGIQSRNMVSLASTPVESLSYAQLLYNGYKFFDVFKGLIVDHMFSFQEISLSREFFFRRDPVDAFKVLEVELNFLYDVLYTKYGVVHCKVGYLCRFLCTAFLVACFQQFASHSKHNIFHVDIIVTYILLCGAVCLDLVGLFNVMFSDWSILLAKRRVALILVRLPFFRTIVRWAKRRVALILVRLPFFRTIVRWSNTMFQHSLLSFCLYEHSRWLGKVATCIGIKATLDELKYKKTTNCDERLKDFIFKELKGKAVKAQTTETMKEAYSARGEFVLRDESIHYGYPSISDSLNKEFDESLLMWHIATEICYLTSSDRNMDREFCKVLSDYLLYLLVMTPMLASAVTGIAHIRIRDTCEEARIFFKERETDLSNASVDQREILACKKLLEVEAVVKPALLNGDSNNSLLFEACILAKDLNKMGQANEESQWKMMSRIWVELLSYAAGHCPANVHARQLTHGGELITFVWLLMVHFGLGEHFRVETGLARFKLLVSR